MQKIVILVVLSVIAGCLGRPAQDDQQTSSTVGAPYHEKVVVHSSLNVRTKDNQRQKRQFGGFGAPAVSKDFSPNNLTNALRGHVSIDNLKMRNCLADSPREGASETTQIKCQENKKPVCIENSRICDLVEDCDETEDEKLNCDKIPFGGYCNFENGWCGWQNSGKAIMSWSRHIGPTPTDKTGPDFDHTFQHTTKSGYYMFVNMNQHDTGPEMKTFAGFASNAVMNSVIFNPPPSCNSNSSSPFYSTCNARFFVHQFGLNPGSFNISVVEMKAKENITTTLWWGTKSLGDIWHRVDVVLPNITSKYFLQVEALKGMRIYSDVAIDDFSMSPECFGFNIPAEHLGSYNYWVPLRSETVSNLPKLHSLFFLLYFTQIFEPC